MTPIGDVSSRILAAATLAEQAAAEARQSRVEWRDIAPRLADRLIRQNRRLIAASGPSHWGAVAELLRASLEIHQGWHVCATGNGDGVTDYEIDSEDGLSICPTLAALLPLVDQIIRDLVKGRGASSKVGGSS